MEEQAATQAKQKVNTIEIKPIKYCLDEKWGHNGAKFFLKSDLYLSYFIALRFQGNFNARFFLEPSFGKLTSFTNSSEQMDVLKRSIW